MALPDQLARLSQTLETSLEIRSQVDRVLGAEANVNIYRDGTFIGEALRIGATDVYSFIDTNITPGVHSYTTNIVDGSYTGPMSVGYSVEVMEVPGGYILMEDSGIVLEETSGGLLMEGGVDAPGLTVFMRDDFDGAALGGFEGRTPNITTAGRSWYGASDQLNGSAFYEITGDGFGISQPGGTGNVAWVNIDLPVMTKVNFEITLRNAIASAELVTAGGAALVFFIELHLGGHVARAGIQGGAVYLNSSNTGAGGGDPVSGLGAGGATVKFNVEWGDGLLRLLINDTLMGQMTVDAPGFPGSPDGDGWLYMEVANNNMADYVQVSGQ